MARDIEEMTEDENHRGAQGDCRITVIFDAFERLNEFRVDDWFVREFCRASGSTLKIILGRESLKWDQYDPIWQIHIDHYPALSNLKPNDALEYLNRRNVGDSDLKNYLIELTDGFPYHLRLAADLCQSILETKGREPGKDDFATAGKNANLGDALLSLILRQLSADEQDATLLLSIPRWFTVDILEMLVAEPASTLRLFQTLTRYSFCEKIPDKVNTYSIRKEARKFLRERARQLKHWLLWNKKMKDFHGQARNEITNLAEMIYHSFIIEPYDAV
ncbi:MAG: hypothetical protein HY867_04675 [Chloroflexi bacterium]|nr:hypothetical protein [Chloroflexota bacterium]